MKILEFIGITRYEDIEIEILLELIFLGMRVLL